MHPVLVSFGSFTLYSYGTCVALATLTGWFLAGRLARASGWSPERAREAVFLAVIFGVFGARLLYAFQNPENFSGRWQAVLFLWEGGLVWYGGFLGAVLAGWVLARLWRVSFIEGMDLFAAVLPLPHAIGRVGCFLNGCCYGIHGQPVQLYEAAALAGLWVYLTARYFRKRAKGEIFGSYLAGYGLIRFFLEFLRGDQTPLYGLSLAQWMSTVAVLAGVWLLKVQRSRS